MYDQEVSGLVLSEILLLIMSSCFRGMSDENISGVPVEKDLGKHQALLKGILKWMLVL